MEKESVSWQEVVGCNQKPTIIEFYADWCSSCKKLAPTMRALEIKYKDRVNFVVLDGMDLKNAALAGKFKVDGIPHLAFLDEEARAQTSLVGEVPRSILEEEVQALLRHEVLPYVGYDAFEGGDHQVLQQPRACSPSSPSSV
eukprot:gene7224-7990_t